MTNREAIKRLSGIRDSEYIIGAGLKRITFNEKAIEAFDLAIAALEKQEANRWIPVTERLPEEKDAGILKKLGTDKRSDYVLTTVEVKGERITATACTYDGKWDWNMKYAFPDYKIIAWRPLPEPYKAEEEL